MLISQLFLQTAINNRHMPVAFRQKLIPAGDILIINKKKTFAEKYGINPEEVRVIASSGTEISDIKKQKTEIIEKLLEAHELSKKNFLTGNITGGGHSTYIRLKNDKSWHLSTNFVMERISHSNICGERSALINAFNQYLKKIPLQSAEMTKQDNLKVDLMLLSGNKNLGIGEKACGECLQWFNSERFYDDKTRIVTFEDKHGELSLKVRNLTEVLPYRKEKDSLMIDGETKISELSIIRTPNSKFSNVSDKEITITMEKVKQAYDSNKLAKFSGQNYAAAVLLDNGEIITAKKVDWNRRWFMEPGEFAAAKAIEQYPTAYVKAIAYYGEGAAELIVANKPKKVKQGVVNLASIGKIIKNNEYGDANTLILSLHNNRIQARTVKDYMPDGYDNNTNNNRQTVI